MNIPKSTTIRSATASDLPRLANLIHFEAFVHRHLDYRPPLDWVGQEPFLVLEESNHINAILACPPDPPDVAWIRLFATSLQTGSENNWEILWKTAFDQLNQNSIVKYIAAIPLHKWFETILRKSQFQRMNTIVTLSLDLSSLPDDEPDNNAIIRPMTNDDLDRIEVIDQMSFAPIWVNSRNYLELGYRQSIIASVAEIDGRVVGYQISTSSPIGGHLARLAVLPEMQGHGVGYAILFDLVKQFTRRAARAITVNTQNDNRASLTLYKRMGFGFTGEEYPCYQINL